MKKIMAIGGAVIKTARDELIQVVENDKIEMLIHNGGSIFHDFQLATDDLDSHSHPLDDLLEDYSCNKDTSKLVWEWIKYPYSPPPENSITKMCEDKKIPVLLFTAMACDFWQLFGTPEDWGAYGQHAYWDYKELVNRFKSPFHYVCMGSAVIHPEVFIKAVADAKNYKEFTADVVDFLEMYRPRTRVARYGMYYKMEHKEYLTEHC